MKATAGLQATCKHSLSTQTHTSLDAGLTFPLYKQASTLTTASKLTSYSFISSLSSSFVLLSFPQNTFLKKGLLADKMHRCTGISLPPGARSLASAKKSKSGADASKIDSSVSDRRLRELTSASEVSDSFMQHILLLPLISLESEKAVLLSIRAYVHGRKGEWNRGIIWKKEPLNLGREKKLNKGLLASQELYDELGEEKGQRRRGGSNGNGGIVKQKTQSLPFFSM